jgi:hypothetical protein
MLSTNLDGNSNSCWGYAHNCGGIKPLWDPYALLIIGINNENTDIIVNKQGNPTQIHLHSNTPQTVLK